MSKRRRTSWLVKLDRETLQRVAATLWTGHAGLLDQGYWLSPKSGIWRSGNGTFTARLAYRSQRADLVSSLVVTIRGIQAGVGE